MFAVYAVTQSNKHRSRVKPAVNELLAQISRVTAEPTDNFNKAFDLFTKWLCIALGAQEIRTLMMDSEAGAPCGNMASGFDMHTSAEQSQLLADVAAKAYCQNRPFPFATILNIRDKSVSEYVSGDTAPIKMACVLASFSQPRQGRIFVLTANMAENAKLPELALFNLAGVLTGQAFEQYRLAAAVGLHRKRIDEVATIEALTTLTGGIIHGLNNNLAIITGYSEMMLADTDPETARHNYSEAILEAGVSAAEALEQLLVYRRMRKLPTATINVPEMLDELVHRLAGTTAIAPSLTYPDTGLPEIEGHRAELTAALGNLCRLLAARYEDAAVLCIEATAEIVAADRTIFRSILPTGSYLRLGLYCGLRPEDKNPLFTGTRGVEDFRSDKALANAIGTVQLMRGSVEVGFSEIGKPAFNIWFRSTKTK